MTEAVYASRESAALEGLAQEGGERQALGGGDAGRRLLRQHGEDRTVGRHLRRAPGGLPHHVHTCDAGIGLG